MKIGVIGVGFVGLTLDTVLASKNYSLIVVDTNEKKSELLIQGEF